MPVVAVIVTVVVMVAVVVMVHVCMCVCVYVCVCVPCAQLYDAQDPQRYFSEDDKQLTFFVFRVCMLVLLLS